MQVDEKCLDAGDLDTALGFSEPLNAVRAFEVPFYSARYVEKVTQKPIEMITTDEAVVELTTDWEPKLTEELDVGYLLGCAEQVLANFDGLAKESERKI
jgi:hypothetical protein